jgi:glycosyltransferase involved in cell wall biosynthesis
MGKPLIATDMPGCREIVEDGVNGFLCAPRDAAALAESMLRLLSLSPEACFELGARARQRAEHEFDERIVIDRYLEALAGLRAGR